MSAGPRLERIAIYPLKGGRAVEMATAWLGPNGLDGDRMFMVADAKSGGLLTQLEVPALAQIAVDWTGRELKLGLRDFPDLLVPRSDASIDCALTREQRRLPGIDCGAAAAQWISSALGRHARLVQVVEAEWSRHYLLQGSPVTLIAQASLDSASMAIGLGLDARRLRANLFISGTTPYEEDHWNAIHIAGMCLTSQGPRTLCRVIEIDQLTGCHSRQVLRAVVKSRKGNPIFGINLQLGGPAGVLVQGSGITVLEGVH